MLSRPCSPRLRPCITDLLRTCLHPHALSLRVEKIVVQTLSLDGAQNSGHDEPSTSSDKEQREGEAYVLWLSDGELMIQAVLEQSLHYMFETGICAIGSMLEITRFRVRRAKRIHGLGDVIYLAIEDCETVPLVNPTTSTEAYNLSNEGGFIREGTPSPRRKRRFSSPLAECLRHPSSPTAVRDAPLSQESEWDGFETIEVDAEVLDRRRQALRGLSSNTKPAASLNASGDQTLRKRRKLLNNEAESVSISHGRHDTAVHFADEDGGKALEDPISSDDLPQAESSKFLAIHQRKRPIPPLLASIKPSAITPATSSSTTPPLHTLISLLQPPSHLPLPSRNYACSVLAIISWCSPNLVFPRHAQSPFPPKRHIKIHDPSIAFRYAGITLAVYDNARTFKPEIGTVALFRGVVMQRWEGEVILNAYARRPDRDRDVREDEDRERGWYVDDEERLVGMGYDVTGMRDWWSKRNQGKGQKSIDR